jgi:hypothetical protein
MRNQVGFTRDFKPLGPFIGAKLHNGSDGIGVVNKLRCYLHVYPILHQTLGTYQNGIRTEAEARPGRGEARGAGGAGRDGARATQF